MENETSMVEVLFEKTESYVKVSAELIKLKVINKTAEIASTLMANAIVVIVLVLFFVIFNIGVSVWIGEMIGRQSVGFFIVAGFYLLLAIVIYAFRNVWIKMPLKNTIIIQGLK